MGKEHIEIRQEKKEKKVASSRKPGKKLFCFFTCTVSCMVPCNNILGSKNPVGMMLLDFPLCFQWTLVNVTS